MSARPPDLEVPPARRGARVRGATLVTFGAVALLEVLAVAGTWRSAEVPLVPGLFVLVTVPLALAVYWHGARILAYELAGSSLVVRRAFLSRRFSLEGLASAEVESDVMRGACRVVGNGGLGAVAGLFRSRRWGSFRAYLSDPATAVVLRWKSGACVMVSPAEPRALVEELRRRVL